MSSDLCAVPGCSGTRVKRSWCNAHYQRWRKYGDPGAPRQVPGPQRQVPGPQRTTAGDCWRCIEIEHLAGTDHLASIAVRVGLQVNNVDKKRRQAVFDHLRRHGRDDLADRLARYEALRQEGAYV